MRAIFAGVSSARYTVCACLIRKNRSHAKHDIDPSASAPMIIPTIQPDEWLEGYRGRLSRLSDISTRFGVEPALRNVIAHGPDNGSGTLSFIGLISMALEMPISDIVLRHTLWPANFAVDRTSDHNAIARQAADNNGKLVFSSPMRRQIWLCPRCVEDDLNQLHFSYWRRSHQLPGQLFCRDHGHELHFVPRTNHLVRLPQEHLGAAAASSTELLEHVRRSAHVTRAVQIYSAILEGQFKPQRGHCAAVLSRRAESLGMTANAAGRFPEVKDLVEQHIPNAWLKDATPRVTSLLNPLGFVDNVFDTSMVGLSGVSIAVVAALLYDDANVALKALGADLPSKKRHIAPKATSLPQLARSTPVTALPVMT